MRFATITVLLVLVAGCAGAPPQVRLANPPAPAAALASGLVYRIDHDVEERLDGSLMRGRRVRVLLWVRGARPEGGFDAIASLTRQEEGTDATAQALVALQLAPDGSLQRDPDLLCAQGGDELFAARFLRHVISPYPRGAELFVEQREHPVRVRSRTHGRQLRAHAELPLNDEEVVLVRASGRVRVRTHADVSAHDPLVFDVRTRIDGSPLARDERVDAVVRPRAIRIDEHTQSTRLELAPPPPTRCSDLGGGDFDPRVVIQMIRTRQGAIDNCYERLLRGDPTLRGEIDVALAIDPDGHVRRVGVTRSTFTRSGVEVGRCVSRVIEGFRFNPGPEGGSATYEFPFAFEP